MPSRHSAGHLVAVLTIAAGISATAFAISHRAVVGEQPDGRILVPNGQTLTPAGTHIEVNERPLGMVVSPNGSLLAVVTGSNFNPRALHLIDLNTRALKQTISIANSFVGAAILVVALVAEVVLLAFQGSVKVELRPFLLVWGLLLIPTFLLWSSFVICVCSLLRNRYGTYATALSSLRRAAHRRGSERPSGSPAARAGTPSAGRTCTTGGRRS